MSGSFRILTVVLLLAGCDEALMLDNEGYVAEGTGENVFVVRQGRLHTPELTSCLDGITRDTIMTLARDMGTEVVERRMTRDVGGSGTAAGGR